MAYDLCTNSENVGDSLTVTIALDLTACDINNQHKPIENTADDTRVFLYEIVFY